MLAAELWDPDSYAAIVEWVMKTGRESGSPLTLRLGLALSVTHAVLTGDLRSAIAATAEEEALADATGGRRSSITGSTWPRCEAAPGRHTNSSRPPRQRRTRRANSSPTCTGRRRYSTTD
ncbi:hypothetical protein GCM10029963_23940 [Micromonospora andamanensis]